MAKVVWMSGIEYVSGALCKCGKKGQHTHDKMLLATHRRAATTNPDCNRLYVRSQVTRKTAPSADELFARVRFTAVAAMVRTRSMDLSKISRPNGVHRAEGLGRRQENHESVVLDGLRR